MEDLSCKRSLKELATIALIVDRVPSHIPGGELGNGKYKIIRRLAVGGMAEIYLAQAGSIHGFRKKVVIKRILPQYASQQYFVDMFLDEARLAARLNHDSIVQVFDIGEDDEGVFFTMEYVEGRDLSDVLAACHKQSKLLSLEEVLAVITPAAEALHHAHELKDDRDRLCNLIHRDVSPSNILVTNQGRVKLLDFGVAKSNDQQRETTGASLKGKFGYMSPEQINGLDLDRRADIFALGVVLWELSTSRRLYPGGNNPPILLKIVSEDAPPPSSRRSNLPAALDAICLRALARDRDERYASLQDLVRDLDFFAQSSGIATNSRTLSRLLADVFPDSKVSLETDATPSDALMDAQVTTATGGASFPKLDDIAVATETPSNSLDDPYLRGSAQFLDASCGYLGADAEKNETSPSQNENRDPEDVPQEGRNKTRMTFLAALGDWCFSSEKHRTASKGSVISNGCEANRSRKLALNLFNTIFLGGVALASGVTIALWLGPGHEQNPGGSSLPASKNESTGITTNGERGAKKTIAETVAGLAAEADRVAEKRENSRDAGIAHVGPNAGVVARSPNTHKRHTRNKKRRKGSQGRMTNKSLKPKWDPNSLLLPE